MVVPHEADTVLLIYADAVLAGTVSLESFESIARRNPEIAELLGIVQTVELVASKLYEPGRALLSCRLRIESIEHIFCPLIEKRLNHRSGPWACREASV